MILYFRPKYDHKLLETDYVYQINVTVLASPSADLRNHVAVIEVPVMRSNEEKEFVEQILRDEPRYFKQLFEMLSMRSECVVLSAWYVFVRSLSPSLSLYLFLFLSFSVSLSLSFSLSLSTLRRVIYIMLTFHRIQNRSLLMDLPTDRELDEIIEAALDTTKAEDGGAMQTMSSKTATTTTTAPNWAAILDSTSALKLLYSLQILERKFKRASPLGDAAKSNFCAANGLTHLISILTSSTSHFFATALSMSSLALLLKVVNELRASNTSLEDPPQSEALLEGMFELLRACSSSETGSSTRSLLSLTQTSGGGRDLAYASQPVSFIFYDIV
tara:strand:- start:16 stop:1005 length:990 start_codon:yes stop_codon:yes gene_type:complete